MKKSVLFTLLLSLGMLTNASAQNGAAPASDFFTGKWEIQFIGTPNGDAKMTTDLMRKDGKLTGELKASAGEMPPVPITKIEEAADKMTIYFSAQGYDVFVELNKVDDDNLKGSLMNMFDAKAMRIKDKDFFAGKWEIKFSGTPNGDGTLVTDLMRKDGKLTGELKDPSGQMGAAIPIAKVEEAADKMTIYFSAQGYDVFLELNKVDDNNLKGTLMNMFDSSAKRITGQ